MTMTTMQDTTRQTIHDYIGSSAISKWANNDGKFTPFHIPQAQPVGMAVCYLPAAMVQTGPIHAVHLLYVSLE